MTLASLSAARAQTRDAIRMSDLSTVSVALELYYNTYNTYQVSGGGSNGNGNGWLTYTNGTTYVTSVTQQLENEGFLSDGDSFHDPGGAAYNYMIYICDGGRSYALSATLEYPKPEHEDYIQTTCNGVGSNGTYTRYGKNYAIGS